MGLKDELKQQILIVSIVVLLPITFGVALLFYLRSTDKTSSSVGASASKNQSFPSAEALQKQSENAQKAQEFNPVAPDYTYESEKVNKSLDDLEETWGVTKRKSSPDFEPRVSEKNKNTNYNDDLPSDIPPIGGTNGNFNQNWNQTGNFDFAFHFLGNGSKNSPFTRWSKFVMESVFYYNPEKAQIETYRDWQNRLYQIGFPHKEYYLKIPSGAEKALFFKNEIISKEGSGADSVIEKITKETKTFVPRGTKIYSGEKIIITPNDSMIGEDELLVTQ